MVQFTINEHGVVENTFTTALMKGLRCPLNCAEQLIHTLELCDGRRYITAEINEEGLVCGEDRITHAYVLFQSEDFQQCTVRFHELTCSISAKGSEEIFAFEWIVDECSGMLEVKLYQPNVMNTDVAPMSYEEVLSEVEKDRTTAAEKAAAVRTKIDERNANIKRLSYLTKTLIGLYNDNYLTNEGVRQSAEDIIEVATKLTIV